MNILQKFEAQQLEQVQQGKNIPEFSPGDTVKVNVKVVEGNRERIQAYEGVCIARNGGGINETFTVRKISYGEGVERVFPLYSPRIDSIELVRRGSVRRAKLYYLRDLRGKAARISERTTGHGLEVRDPDADTMTKTAKRAQKREDKKARAEAAKKEAAALAKAKADAKAAEEAAAQADAAAGEEQA